MTTSLISLADQARWHTGRLVDSDNTTDTAQIPFQGSDADARGFVRVDTVTMEDGKRCEALRTHPKWVNRGTVKGFFPWMDLPADAVLTVDVGFLEGASRSDGVHFQVWVHYLENGREQWYRVGSLIKSYTGKLSRMRCDLSRFSGQRVALELRCDALDSSAQDWAAWVDPRVVSSQTVGDLPVTVSLDRFYCHNAEEDDWGSDGDEPYLFVVVIAIDGNGIKIESLDNASVRIFTAPHAHGNLNRTGVEQGDNFAIPANTGQFSFNLKAVQPLGNLLPLSLCKTITQVGVAVIAMEEDGTSDDAANKARKTIASSLQTQLDTLLRSKIKAAVAGGSPEVTAAEINGIVAAVQSKVVDSIKKSTVDNLNFVGMVDPDDYAGSNYGLWSYNDLEQAGWRGVPINWEFKDKPSSPGVRYGITGKIRIG